MIYEKNIDNIQDKMLKNNIYKINWFWGNKFNWKSYLDLMFEKIWIKKFKKENK